MAKHKAPTEVTIVPTQEASGLALWVQHYWKLAAAAGVLIAVAILATQYIAGQRVAAQYQSWAELTRLSEGGIFGNILADPDELKPSVEETQGTIAGPWGLYVLALSFAQERRYDEALQALSQLRDTYPDHLLTADRFRFGDDETPRTLSEQLSRILDDQRVWEGAHPTLFENPPPPEGAPRVRIATDKGNILVALYPDRAPQHVENFLKLCEEGFYTGTRFHRVVKGRLVQGGDPNSKEGEPSTWGQGTNGGTIPAEESGLAHFSGALAAAKPAPGGPSSDCQFYVMTSPYHFFDASYTVFGMVLEGLDVVEEIEAEPLEPGTERPVTTVSITGTEIL